MSIPAHTPDAAQLTMTYGAPDAVAHDSQPNRTKAEWAHAAFLAYMPLAVSADVRYHPPGVEERWSDTDFETLLSDLIADLLHLATFTGCDTEVVLHRASRDFEAEVGRGYGA